MIQDTVRLKQLEECGATYRHFDMSGENVMYCEILDLATGKVLVTGKGVGEIASFEDAFGKWNPGLTPVSPAQAIAQLAEREKQIEELKRQLAQTQGLTKESPTKPTK